MSLVHVNSEENIVTASEIIKKGGLVAMPTETVYGLAADATNDKAVARIFEAKGRPQFNPLISHFATIEQAANQVVFDDLAYDLAQTYWPGPLTFVLKRRADSILSHLVTAGLDTAAVRIPDNKTALSLIGKAGVPLAAPSANRSGSLSPTTAVHVAESLGGAVDMVLADARSKIGLESTVLDLSVSPPTLLRHGYVTFEELQKTIPDLVDGTVNHDGQPKSPGQLLKHYAPNKALRLNVLQPEKGEALLCFGPWPLGVKVPVSLNLSEKGDLQEAAANLFSMLHELDKSDAQAIAVMPIPQKGLGAAINDRLTRAAQK